VNKCRYRTIMINNMKSKKESKKNQDTNLCGSIMCLHPQECDYLNNNLRLQHNIFITKSY